jgi:D-alanyl-lipoteichoic acid acyltransferase DltB (MBOAT superfamily)
MQFNSYSYLFILGCAVIVFWLLPVYLRKWYILALSVLFYYVWCGLGVLVPLLVAASTYLCATKMIPAERKWPWLWSGIGIALLCLAFFKFESPIFRSLPFHSNVWLNQPAHWILLIGVPLGTSFYCFDAIGLLLDTKQGRFQRFRASDVLLFIMFWPTVTSGPIVRFRELVAQFKFDSRFDSKEIISGLDRILVGLVQKNLVANSLNSWIAEGFNSKSAFANTTVDNWFLAIAFGMQIYFDFAAYSNMVIGAGKLIGIRLPENFRYPYHALTPSDFWSRWHMSLSRWIRDYLFFPVNARFKGSSFVLFASMIGIMAAVGLWHGAGWGFILWGVLHGCYLVAYRIWEVGKVNQRAGSRTPTAEKVLWRIVTPIAVFVAWVPFRAGSLRLSFAMLHSMFLEHRFNISYQLNFYLVTLLILAWCMVEPHVNALSSRLDSWSMKNRVMPAVNLYLARPLLYAAALLLFFAFDERNTQFIYFQF